MHTRPYRPTDAEAVATMVNAIDTAAGRQASLTGSLIHEFLGERVAETTTDSRLVVGDDGVLAAGFVITPPAGGHRVDLIGGVLPGARGQGIGRTMLGWQVGRAEEIHAALAPGASWETYVEASQRDASALALFARFGLTPTRYEFDMAASTADVPDCPVPDGLVIATYDAGQAHALHEAHMEAFVDHYGFQHRTFEVWQPTSIGSASFNPALSIIAMDGAEIAGYVLSYDDAIPEQVYIGQVGVRRPYRRRGLAAAMLVDMMRRAAAAGRSRAALGVDTANPTGAVGVYERVGFHTEHTMVACGRPLN
ncbi:GNAT family N-acetyltransferase [Streptosporangiaceae bacterium NEAU-GS5]|nr:GNAT family N-acetyltransferase [Streptosporangiaceae bacterium NEAU-GS5]